MNKVSSRLLIALAFLFALVYPLSSWISILGGLLVVGVALFTANDKVKRVCLEPFLIILTVFVFSSVFSWLFNLINYFVVLCGGTSVSAFSTIMLVINILCYLWAILFLLLSIIYNLKSAETPLYSRLTSFLIETNEKKEESNEDDEEDIK